MGVSEKFLQGCNWQEVFLAIKWKPFSATDLAFATSSSEAAKLLCTWPVIKPLHQGCLWQSRSEIKTVEKSAVRYKPGPGYIKQHKIKCEFSATIIFVLEDFLAPVSQMTLPKTD